METGYSTLVMTVCDLNGRVLRQDQVTGRDSAIRAWRNGEHQRMTAGLAPGSYRVHVDIRSPSKAEMAEAIDSYSPDRRLKSLGAAIPDKYVFFNNSCIGTAATWGGAAATLRKHHPSDPAVERIAYAVERGILGEMSWRAVETPSSFTIAAAFGSSGLALAMIVQ